MKKILIVDDQREIRELVDATLGSEDYQIFQAENGEQALETAKRNNFDLIIMDIHMHGAVDGLEATRIIKNDPRMKKCKIIMLTGDGADDNREQSLECGADDYFSKPFSPLQLIQKIESILDQ